MLPTSTGLAEPIRSKRPPPSIERSRRLLLTGTLGTASDEHAFSPSQIASIMGTGSTPGATG